MENDDLIFRIKRIYTAIGAMEETDISKFAPKVINDGNRVGFYQDWKGDLGDEELSNMAHLLIHNMANLRGHLMKWAHHNGKDKVKVDNAFNGSQALKIIQDLSNNDKHGYPPRDSGHSGLSPMVDRINTIMRMATRPEKGSSVRLTFNRQGIPQVAGSGTAKVIITGDIRDKGGCKIGDLHDTALEAVKIWESVLDDFGVKS